MDPAAKKSRARKIDRRRKGVAMPLEYACILICERFPGAGAPWDLEEDERGDRIRYYMNLMGIEAEIKDALADLGPEDYFERGD